MLAAIIATIATLVVLVIAVVIAFTIRNRTKAPKASSKRMDVRAIKTVGMPAGRGASRDTHVNAPQTSAVNLGETLKSRFAAMGVLAAAVFGSLTAKVWSLQILDSEAYRREAEENQYRTVYTPAPRGYIYDADGYELVRNRTSLTVLADAEVAQDRTVVQRLSAVLGIPHNIVRMRILDETTGAQSQRVVASDVDLRAIAFIDEHKAAFPGVTTQDRAVREYPWGALAAHALGYVGTVTSDGLEAVVDGEELEMGDVVGQSGVEYSYNRYLAGAHGMQVVVADAKGAVQGIVSESQPEKGNDIYLTLKAPVQYAVDRMLADLVAPTDSTIGTGKGDSASAIVMDVRDGSIVAMASYPTFTPGGFVPEISDDLWSLYSTDKKFEPLLNRVIAGQYAAASTFKAFTGLAGLAYGFADTSRSWDCTGSWDGFNTGAPQRCWLRTGHGALGFRGGIVESCDTVFYEIGKSFFQAGESQGGTISDTAMQDYVKKYQFGTLTGVDIPGEGAGRIPTPTWKAEYWKDVPEAQQWVGGDLTNMVIGQGDVLVTPLQVAVAYGAIATGNLMKPHFLKEVRNSSNDVVVEHEPEVVGVPDVPAENLAIMRDALHGVATENESVAKLFAEYGIDAAAKTGTAEYSDGQIESAWFACYAPYDDPKYVVVCQVNHGGGGSEVAAPLGVDIMATALRYDAGELEPTIGVVAGSSGKYIDLPLKSDGSGRTD
ncbi:penicillin-binding protein 2 [Raoultibacter phocaeensis]|uniref:penicillin-binding protein 2 n=1 Tax=Raoultibacter phocaeensis TaxID=2479841 RepID=UPI001117BE1F|nr:penicillin-binding protein 2 [Raoultibacter phocaeensis]